MKEHKAKKAKKAKKKKGAQQRRARACRSASRRARAAGCLLPGRLASRTPGRWGAPARARAGRSREAAEERGTLSPPPLSPSRHRQPPRAA